MTTPNYRLPQVNSHSQISTPKKKISVHVLEAGVGLLIIVSVVLAIIDPTIRVRFLELTQIILVAYIGNTVRS